MKTMVATLLAGALVAAGLWAFQPSMKITIAGGAITAIVVFVVCSVFAPGRLRIAKDPTTDAVQTARAYLHSIRITAIELQRSDLVQAASELSTGFEDVFRLIEETPGGYAKVGLTLALLKPLSEAAGELTRQRNNPGLPQMIDKLKTTMNDALTDLRQNAEGINEARLRDFRLRCETVTEIAAQN